MTNPSLSTVKPPAPTALPEHVKDQLQSLLAREKANPVFAYEQADPQLEAARRSQLQELQKAAADCPDCARPQDGRHCPVDNCAETKPYCPTHWARHVSLNHPDSETYLYARDQHILELLAAGLISKAETPERLYTAKGSFPHFMHNNFFAFFQTYMNGRYAPARNPLILTWKSVEVEADNAASDQNVQALQQEFDRFNWLWNTVHLGGTASENYTSCLATAVNPGLSLLPQDNRLERSQQNRNFWFTMLFSALPGKMAKSLRNIMSSKPGGTFHPEPSYWPELKINGDLALTCHRIDTGKAGSGSGTIKLSAAYQLLKAGCAQLFIKGGLLMLYLVYFAADHSAKGQYVIVPDDRFPKRDPQGNPLPPEVDFLIDSDNFNDRILSNGCTMTAFFPIYPNERQAQPHFMLEPVHMLENLRKLVNGSQLCVGAHRITMALSQGLTRSLRDQDNMRRFDSFHALDPWLHQAQAWEDKVTERLQENPAASAIHAAEGHRPWVSPQVISHLTRLWDSWEGDRKRKALPSLPISGHRVWAMYHYYAGVPEPEPGCARLVYNRDDQLQPVGMAINDQDFQSLAKNALDGYDCDDSVYLVLMRDDAGVPKLNVMREPMSPEGGIILRVPELTAKYLQEHGTYCYQQTGEKDFPDLYASVDGELIRKPIVESDPAPELERWSNQEPDFVRQVSWMTRFRRYYGGVVNAIYAIYFAGLYDPERHHTMLSDALDDALGGNRNPNARQVFFINELLQAVKDGAVLEAGTYTRVARKMEAQHKANWTGPGKPPALNVPVECISEHHRIQDTMLACIQELHEASHQVRLLANGPISALTQRYSPQTVQAAVAAFGLRNREWSRFSLERKRWLKHRPQEAEANIVGNRDKVKDSIIANFASLHRQWQECEDFQKGDALPGDLMGCYVQLMASRDARWKKPANARYIPNQCTFCGEPYSESEERKSRKKPYMEELQTRDADLGFPREERDAYYARSSNAPSALLDLSKAAELPAPGTRLQVGLNADLEPTLQDEIGNDLVILPPHSGLPYLGCQLEAVGPIPIYEDAEGAYQLPDILVCQVREDWEGVQFNID